MNPTNTSIEKHFSALLNAEIDRCRYLDPLVPPDAKHPLTLDEYRQWAVGHGRPTDEQIRNFTDTFEDDLPHLLRQAWAGCVVFPTLLPQPHNLPVFTDDHLKRYGRLYYYVVNEEKVTLRADDLAYMDAILPREVIENGITLTDDLFHTIQKQAELPEQFRKSVERLMGMIFG